MYIDKNRKAATCAAFLFLSIHQGAQRLLFIERSLNDRGMEKVSYKDEHKVRNFCYLFRII